MNKRKSSVMPSVRSAASGRTSSSARLAIRSQPPVSQPTASRPVRTTPIRATTFDELRHNDFQSALMMWLVVEVLSFLVLPIMLGSSASAILHKLFVPSLVLGLGGAWLMASMSRFIAINQQRSHAGTRWVLSMMAQAVSWIAVAGILYPLISVIGGGLAHAGLPSSMSQATWAETS